MRPPVGARAGAVALVISLAVTACGDDSDSPSVDAAALGEQAQQIVFDAAYEQLQAEFEAAGGDEGALSPESAAALDELRGVELDPAVTDLDEIEADQSYEQTVNTLTDGVPALYNRWNSLQQALVPVLEHGDVDASSIESAAPQAALEVVFEDEYLNIYAALSGGGVDDELTSDQTALLTALGDDSPDIDPSETSVQEIQEVDGYDGLVRRVIRQVPRLDAVAEQLSEQIVEHRIELLDTRQ